MKDNNAEVLSPINLTKAKLNQLKKMCLNWFHEELNFTQSIRSLLSIVDHVKRGNQELN